MRSRTALNWLVDIFAAFTLFGNLFYRYFFFQAICYSFSSPLPNQCWFPNLNRITHGGWAGGTLFQNNGSWGIVPNTSQLLNFYPAMNRNREGFQKLVKKMCILGVRPNTRKEFVENACDCWQLANFLHMRGYSGLIKKGLHVCVRTVLTFNINLAMPLVILTLLNILQ